MLHDIPEKEAPDEPTVQGQHGTDRHPDKKQTNEGCFDSCRAQHPQAGGGGWPAQGCMFAACDSRHMYFGLVYCICSAAVSQWLTVVVHLFCLAVLRA